MHKDIERVMFTEETIRERVAEIASQISNDYKGKKPLIIGILKGAFIFMSDLVKNIEIDCDVDFMVASSYGKRVESSGVVAIRKNVEVPVENRDIILVEDIVDSGNTLSTIKNLMLKKNASSVKICTLFDKPSRRKVAVDVDYSCFEIEDAFIVGYGLDYDEIYRNLPYVGVLKPEVYKAVLGE